MFKEKKKCSCGYETEYRCKIHPSRPAHIMTHNVWLCHDCEARFSTYEHGALYDTKEYALYRFLEQNFVLCPGCAHEQAIFEDAQKELEHFLDQSPLIFQRLVEEGVRFQF